MLGELCLVSCVTGGAVNNIGAPAKARRKTSGGILCFLRAFIASIFWVGAGGYVLSMIPNSKFALTGKMPIPLDRQDAYPTRQARCLSHLLAIGVKSARTSFLSVTTDLIELVLRI